MRKLTSIFTIVIAVFIIIMVSFGSLANAADVDMKWDATPGATSYKIQMSTDMGVTWVAEQEISGAPLLVEYTWVGAPDTGLILFRLISCNANACIVRPDAGAWYNRDWQSPALPSGIGIK